ncbi:MAG: response regulator transcription factor [Rhodobacteraceae bacterium]|nr:response regulator transcription factor [Paracoccaceae bacterium]
MSGNTASTASYPIYLLVVEDDPAFRKNFITQLLREQDFRTFHFGTVKQAGNKADAMDIVRSDPPDLIVLDDCIPDARGGRPRFQAREVIDELRREGVQTPILVFTALQDSAPFDESDLLRLCGSIDYVNKLAPHLVKLALARTKNLLMRARVTGTAQMIVGPWIYDQRHCRLRLRPDAGIKNYQRYSSRKLAPKEASILNHLLSVGGRAVPKSELLKSVWGQEDYDTNTIATTVGRLRANLRIEGWPNSIVYVPNGRGKGKLESGGYELRYQSAPARMQRSE